MNSNFIDGNSYMSVGLSTWTTTIATFKSYKKDPLSVSFC